MKKGARQKKAIREILRDVSRFWARPPERTPNQWMIVTMMTAAIAMTLTGKPVSSVAYSPMAMATAEMAPAKPAIKLVHPARNPIEG